MDKKKILHNAAKISYILEKASHEPAYKKELLKHPKEVLSKEGVDIEKKKINCYENTSRDFHVIVPSKPLEEKQKLSTLSKNASLEQIMRFIITQVQTNTSLKERLLSNASEVLKEKGVKLPQNLNIHVHQSTPDTGCLVVPRAPTNDTELNDFEMQAIAGGAGSFFGRNVGSGWLPTDVMLESGSLPL